VDFSEARDLFVNIFQILGPNCKILGLRVDFGKAEGPKYKMAGNFSWGFIFQRISRGPGPRVVNWARRAWSTADRRWRGPRVLERGGALTRVWPPAAPVHQRSLAGAQKRERSIGSSARASPELGRRRGDRVMEVAQRGHGNSVGRGSGEREEKGSMRCEVLRGSSGWFLQGRGVPGRGGRG
jgi:hypothetical protein